MERKLTHKPAFTNPAGRGDVVGFYSVAILKDGTRAFEYMTKDEIIKHEEKYRKGKYKNDIWNKNFEEMAMKTVTKKMLKWLPISVEMIENLRKDEQSFKLEKNNVVVEDENLFDGTFINEETGEIKEEITTEVASEDVKPIDDDVKGLFDK